MILGDDINYKKLNVSKKEKKILRSIPNIGDIFVIKNNKKTFKKKKSKSRAKTKKKL